MTHLSPGDSQGSSYVIGLQASSTYRLPRVKHSRRSAQKTLLRFKNVPTSQAFARRICRVYRVLSPLPCFSARLGCIAGDRVLSASLTGSEAVTTRHSLPFASGLRGYFKGRHLPQLPGAACSRADYAIGPGFEPTAISFQGIS
ncbi:hypothetical protein B0H16DRAFT_1718386 [Mycena metata]|uniref:Uncharacterized protein n=1 Tax=Mycena metata TaxID=1033252 RepID=A0AAD7JG49_9AGAR|nr:hypothetical protein B0H16DRAFT_1718386 [Mycena metata]